MDPTDEYYIPMRVRVAMLIAVCILGYLYYQAGPYSFAEKFPIE